MKFNYKQNTIEIIFEETDTDIEKRIVEQGLAFIKSLLSKFYEIK